MKQKETSTKIQTRVRKHSSGHNGSTILKQETMHCNNYNIYIYIISLIKCVKHDVHGMPLKIWTRHENNFMEHQNTTITIKVGLCLKILKINSIDFQKVPFQKQDVNEMNKKLTFSTLKLHNLST